MSDKKPGYLFQASMQIGESVSLTVSGNLGEGASSADMVTEWDKVLNALEKQNIRRMKIPAVQGALRDQQDALNRAIEQREKLRDQETSGQKLKATEKAQLDTCDRQIEGISAQVEKGKEILENLLKDSQ